LIKWIKTHGNNPYPSEKQKEDLAVKLNLKKKQVNNWFINTRKVNLNSLWQPMQLSSG